mmetsp:Transcript_29471/g.71136  ORF Transcript_29471/g.71136 Transcript_29471/m.71136 type:complete len:128 (+) Transcript_29471:1892-2275(+)
MIDISSKNYRSFLFNIYSSRHLNMIISNFPLVDQGFEIILDDDRARSGRGEKLSIDLGSHENSSTESAADQEDPDRSPAERSLERTNSQQTDGCRDRTSSVDKTGDSTKRLAASTDRRVRCQVGSDS